VGVKGEPMESFTDTYLAETRRIVEAMDAAAVERLAEGLAGVRERSGRLFILGVGGSAGHASHAVNDFRKLCALEAYTPVDNASELTARINDEGWDTCFSAWLEGSHLGARDGVLVFSVGGGDQERGISTNIVNALEVARATGCFIGGVVGRDGGHTARVGDAVVVIPALVEGRVTAHTEGLCAVVWHLLVSHPRLQRVATKWESAVGAPGPVPLMEG
jgi:D-sedoheptulose 7-phosphate isomerase